MTPARPPQTHRSEVPLDTLGKLADRGFRLFGSCLDCALSYRPELGPRNRSSQFTIDLAALIAERGRNCEIVGMRRVPCPRCGGRRTEIRPLAAQSGSGDVARSANDGGPQ